MDDGLRRRQQQRNDDDHFMMADMHFHHSDCAVWGAFCRCTPAANGRVRIFIDGHIHRRHLVSICTDSCKNPTNSQLFWNSLVLFFRRIEIETKKTKKENRRDLLIQGSSIYNMAPPNPYRFIWLTLWKSRIPGSSTSETIGRGGGDVYLIVINMWAT